MPRFPYTFFNNFVVRQPLSSRAKFQNFLDEKEIDGDYLKKICTDPVFQEAIYLASPYLNEQMNTWLSGKKFPPKETEKLKNSLLKYYIRMSTRCTPFGLFSGVGLGEFCNNNEKLEMTNDEKFPLNPPSVVSFIRDTKLDMHFLVALAEQFVKTFEIRNQLLFFPNNSIHQIGKRIRYVEYEYNKGKRDYIISSAPFSEELQKVLNFSKEGKTIEQISEILINEEIEDSPALRRQITKDDAKDFIEELIDNQVLVSELEPNVSGNDFFESIISVLNKIKTENTTEVLISIKEKLNELDLQTGNPASKYTEIEKLIQTFYAEYDRKYLFQTDLYYKDSFTLPFHWKKELKTGICLLNKITRQQNNTHLEKFKKAFYERFEDREMPLLYVLDTELGIGYGENNAVKGVHSYVEDLNLPVPNQKQDFSFRLTMIQKILNEKVQDAMLNNSSVIDLSDEDFQDFDEKWDDLPDTLSLMAEVVSENNQEKLYLGSGSGSSAANLLGRFCSEKTTFQNLTKEITRKEEMLRQALHDNREILAEIIHLPEARIGNVIRRPSLRNYEIPYLAQSVLPQTSQISVDDLYISLKNDKLVLVSKKLNKEVKPYLTNAHNYHHNSLPVYHFLCDLQTQNTRSGLFFNWGDLSRIYQFLPRVEYKNIILSKAQWNVNEKDVSTLKTFIEDKEKFLFELKLWRNKRKIPAYIQWSQSDNKLVLNLENYDLAKIFFETVEKLKSIVIEEFLYNENNNFSREFIFLMHKNETQEK